MTVNLTCTQVGALLSFYMEDKLSNQLKQFVESHLEICPACRAKYEALRTMVASLKEGHKKIDEIQKPENADCYYDEFRLNLSAYADNELSDEENIKVKKMIIANPKAREELEKLYKLKKMMNNVFEKEKNAVKLDFSKFVLKRIDIQEEVYGNDSFARVIALFIFISAVFILTAFVIFWV